MNQQQNRCANLGYEQSKADICPHRIAQLERMNQALLDKLQEKLSLTQVVYSIAKDQVVYLSINASSEEDILP